jgi:ribosomal protein L4
MNRQTDRGMVGQTDRQMNRQAGRGIDRQTEIRRKIWTGRQRDG